MAIVTLPHTPAYPPDLAAARSTSTSPEPDASKPSVEVQRTPCVSTEVTFSDTSSCAASPRMVMWTGWSSSDVTGVTITWAVPTSTFEAPPHPAAVRHPTQTTAPHTTHLRHIP